MRTPEASEGFTASLAPVPPGLPFEHRDFCDAERAAREFQRYMALPVVRTQLPRRLPGGYLWSHYRPVCPTCSALIDEEHFHGRIVQLLPGVLDLDGLFLCENCRHLSPIRVRIRDAGGASAQIEYRDDEAEWVQDDVAGFEELDPAHNLSWAEQGQVHIRVVIALIMRRLRAARS